MGALEIHLERVDNDAVTHVGVRELGKSYELAHVFGFPAFRRFSVAASGRPLPRFKSSSGLPHNASPEVHRAATRLAAVDEGSFRHLWFRNLGGSSWDERVERTYVHGPRNHHEYRASGKVCRLTAWDATTEARIASQGFRHLMPEVMDRFTVEHPEAVADRAQALGKVFTLISVAETLAEELGFADALAWMRAQPKHGELRLVIWAEA